MSGILRLWQSPRIILGSTFLLIATLAAASMGQAGGAKGPARHFEYVHQEIQADALTQSLNDLDGQGWEVFQIVPSWQIKNENAETILSPRAYVVFGRRPIAAK